VRLELRLREVAGLDLPPWAEDAEVAGEDEEWFRYA
jgi:hypothetical protein